jgi:dTDP-4-amino-4,6-dideoxygalactose transaminase
LLLERLVPARPQQEWLSASVLQDATWFFYQAELHAAVALTALDTFDANLDTRRRGAARYIELFAEIPGLEPQHVDPGDTSTWKDFTIAVDPAAFGVTRDVLVEALRAEGVDTRNYFDPPVHRQRSHRDAITPLLPVTEQVAARVVSLPLYPQLEPGTIEAIAELCAEVHANAGRLKAGAVIDLTLESAPVQVRTGP